MPAVSSLQSTPTIKTASLLGLPRELRLQIYRNVFSLDLKHVVVERWRDTFTTKDGFKSVPDLNEDEKLLVPWLCLMLSCKSIAVELRSIMEETSFLEDRSNLTYDLDLEATRGGMSLGAVMLNKIPCPPDKVMFLNVHYNASRGFLAWGDGGPHGITSGLYQTLNHLLHCGPRLDSKKLLPQPMHITELRVMVESWGATTDNGEDRDADYRLSERHTDPETTLYALGSVVGQIVNTGVLKGFVDRIRMTSSEKVLRWLPGKEEGTGIPEYWNRYGFDWGMDLYLGNRT